MKRLYTDTRPMDAAVREKYLLTDDIMMENAAAAMEKVLGEKCPADGRILIVCGSGDNGGDGYVLARRIPGAVVWSLVPPKSESCKRQRLRAERAGVPVVEGNLAAFKASSGCFSEASSVFFGAPGLAESPKCSFAAVVDCVFGIGFHGEPRPEISEAIAFMNDMPGFKLACDVPSCLAAAGSLVAARSVVDGSCSRSRLNPSVFRADVTVTMGALKKVLYSEFSKDYVGQVTVGDLGIPASLFEGSASVAATPHIETFLLEEADLQPPHRTVSCVHKGTYGHGAIVTGEKSGAGIIAGSAAFAYGAGLVTLVSGTGASTCPPELMQSLELPSNTSAVALGMGYGRGEQNEASMAARLNEILEKRLPVILDADAFYCSSLPEFLGKTCGKLKTVLTPHPKEFLSLLEITGVINRDCAKPVNVGYVVENREELAAEFCRKYPGVVILVKGAVPLVSVCEDGMVRQFVNPLGRNCLAKGGSGDVLSGLVCALLAQGYSALDAALQASLAHAMASRKIATDYGMTPFMLIEACRFL